MLAVAVWFYFFDFASPWYWKYASEDVMIDNAVDYLISHQAARIYGSATDKDGRREETKVIPYASKEEFLSENPDCCAFEYRDPEIFLSKFYRVAFGYGGMVLVRYKIHGLSSVKPSTHQMRRIVFMNRYGVPIPSPY